MPRFFKKYGLLIWLSLLLVAGFTFTTIAAYLTARNTMQASFANQTLPITAESIYTEIQKDIMQPVLVSSQMANDTFLRDWLIHEENNTELVYKYLKEVKTKNNAVVSFVISDKTRKYYTPSGVLTTLSETDPRDQWYMRVRKLSTPFETNVDPDGINPNQMNVYVNYRMFDYSGNYIGITGIALSLDSMKRMIDSYQLRFKRNIFFTDAKGKITLAGSNILKNAAHINQIGGLQSVSNEILNSSNASQVQLEYSHEGNTWLVNSRYIPELGWNLIVQHNIDQELKPLQNTFLVLLSISAGITLTVILIMVWMVLRYQRKLERTASTDSLTGLLNRHAFDFVFQQALLDGERTRQPMCVVLLDIDHFKKINDKHGHLVGDHVLKEVGMIAKRSLRESDVICRWGGEEFLILLKNCALSKATSIAENMRSTVTNYDFSRTTNLLKSKLNVTVSMGVAQYKDQESEDSMFERADQALYQAKTNGRNSVYFSE